MRRLVRAVRPFLLGSGVTAALAVGAFGIAAAEDAKPSKTRALTPPERIRLVTALKAYLDPDGDLAATKRELTRALSELKGYEFLADDQLPSLIYQARPFPKPPFSKRMLPKGAEFKEAGTTVSLSAELDNGTVVKTSLALPKTYVHTDPKKPVDRPPTPLLVTLHEEQDYQGPKGAAKFPGEEVLKRRFDPAGPSKAVLDEWAIMAPVVPKGKWIADPKLVEVKSIPLQAVWDRYHVDFDRFVLDGTADALTLAAARPHLFAGVIVRGDAVDLAPELVKNLAGMSVYVVGSASSAAAKTLAANEHPADRVKVGGPEGLADWLKTVRRTTPKSFHWTMMDSAMRTAHWVQITSAENSMIPTMDVEVVDSAEEPNTIKIRTKGVRGIALMLNDRIVDLDREVRIVLNKQPLKTVHVSEGDGAAAVTLPGKFSRSLQTTFGEPLKVRKNLSYGMLFPVIIDGIVVPGDDPGDGPPAPAPGAAPAGGAPAAGAPPAGGAEQPAAGTPEAKSPEDIEAEAKRLFEKAEGLEKDGEIEGAVKLYKKAAAQGQSTVKEKAEAKAKELEAKGSTPK